MPKRAFRPLRDHIAARARAVAGPAPSNENPDCRRLKTVEQMLGEQGRTVAYMAEMSGIDLADLTDTHAALLQSFFACPHTSTLPTSCESSTSLEWDLST